MSAEDRSRKFCIVGAGSSGLAAAKAFVDAGIPFDCLEREDDVGGNWYYGRPHSSVYASTHTISSKRLTEYVDFPMPADYPEYPHHAQVWEYLKSYARKFGLYERIAFGTTIERIERDADGWIVRLADSTQRRYRGIVVANGHNWKPRLPAFALDANGARVSSAVIHSAEYKTPDVFVGKRVLVVGAGNSGCDIAVEAAQHAARTLHSTRRGYHYLPKFWRGMPIDQLNEKLLRYRLPKPVRRMLGALVERVSFGPAGSYGLPKPDHKLFESHPIINQQLFYYLAHGRIATKPDVTSLTVAGGGESPVGPIEVRFADGSREEVDVVVFATGFEIAFPFLDRELLNWHGGKPRLFLNVFHPERDDLFVVGLIQPDSGQFGLVDHQARLVARYVAACDRRGPEAERFRRLKTDPHQALDGGMQYLATERHLLEVEHFSYRRKLEKLLWTL